MLKSKMRLETVLSESIPVQNAAHNPDVFGIEVELEGKNICSPPASVSHDWTTHNDGSLRKLNPGDECIEYLFREPYNMDHTRAAVANLFDYLTQSGVEVYDSYRTSIHVHVNCGMETYRTIYNFIALSIILDELLVSQNGEHRVGNNFCLRSGDALGQLVALIQSVQQEMNFFGIHANDRYSATNFASLNKYGSIEFRSLECTTHAGRLMHWVGTLQSIKEHARRFKNPIEIIRNFSLVGAKEFLANTLGPYAIKYQNVEGYESILHNGMRIAQDFAFCSEWNEISNVEFDKQEKIALNKMKVKF